MPANLTPEYRAAEAAFRNARDPVQRLQCLREMLRVIPKHKGTDHLQGDIRRRIKELSEELERPRGGGAHGGPALVIRPEGAAQIALVGPPNAGKSSLHRRLTGSEARVAPYPLTTHYPEPGMMPYECLRWHPIFVACRNRRESFRDSGRVLQMPSGLQATQARSSGRCSALPG